MRMFNLSLVVLVTGLIVSGCGSTGVSDGNDITSDKEFRLVAAEEVFVENESENRFVEITYSQNNEKLYKEIDQSLIHYRYTPSDANFAAVEKSVSSSEADIFCDLIIEEGRIVEKRFSSAGGTKGSVSDFIILFTYDADENIVRERHKTITNTIETPVADIDYKYAYSDHRGEQFVLIEKHYVSADDNIRVYYRYASGESFPYTIEYDTDGDYSIDYITELAYDSYGNQIRARNSEYLFDGGKEAVSTITYFWEEGTGGSAGDLSQLWDDGKNSFTARFR